MTVLKKPFFPDIAGPAIPAFVKPVFWTAAFLLISIIHFPPQRILSFFPHSQLDTHVLAGLRASFFLFGLVVMFLPIYSCIILHFKNRSKQIILTLFKTFLWTVFIYIILSLLAAPYWPNQAAGHITGLRLQYEQMAQDPFGTNTEIVFRRLFMPGLAYFLGFSSGGYGIFVELCTFFLIWAISIFLYTRIKIPGRFSSSFVFLLALSFASSSFVIGCLPCPGFPDPLALFLLLVPTLLPLSSLARLAISTLALMTHEGAAFIILPLALFFYPRRELKGHLILLGLFALGWAASYHFDLRGALTAHDIIGPNSRRMDWLHKFFLVIFGIFISFKFFGAFVPDALILPQGPEGAAIRKGIIAILISIFLFLLMAWDTTRLTGFAFLAILFSVVIVLQNGIFQRFLLPITLLLVANLLLPTYDVMLRPPGMENPRNYRFEGAYLTIDKFLEAPLKKLYWPGHGLEITSPGLKEEYYDLGNAYTKGKFFTQAIDAYSRAIKIDPAYKEAYRYRAVVYYQLKEYDKAQEDIRRLKALEGQYE